MSETSEIELGPAARKLLEATLSQAAGGLLAAIIEASQTTGRPVAGRWALTIERATLTCTPSPPNGADYRVDAHDRHDFSPPPSPSLSETAR